MSESLSDRRLAENEVIFRQMNKKVQESFDETKRVAYEEGQEFLIGPSDEEEFYFYCECADEKCRKRILMALDTYNKIHSDKNCFIVLPDHQVTRIETVVRATPSYLVVKKRHDAPSSGDELNETGIQNV